MYVVCAVLCCDVMPMRLSEQSHGSTLAIQLDLEQDKLNELGEKYAETNTRLNMMEDGHARERMQWMAKMDELAQE